MASNSELASYQGAQLRKALQSIVREGHMHQILGSIAFPVCRGIGIEIGGINTVTSGSKQVSFVVPIQITRVQPDDVGLFLSELRFESQLVNSQVLELTGHNKP